MKRISTRLIITFITFVLGVAAVYAWFIYRKPIPPVTVCDLIRNPENYMTKEVRVKAVLFGADEKGLYSPDCEEGGSRIHFIIKDQKVWRQLQAKGAVPKDARMYPLILANVTVNGRFEKYREVECDERGRQLGAPYFSYTNYCYEFFVSDVEQVEPTDVALPK